MKNLFLTMLKLFKVTFHQTKRKQRFKQFRSTYIEKEKENDGDGIRTHACRAQWISSPSP